VQMPSSRRSSRWRMKRGYRCSRRPPRPRSVSSRNSACPRSCRMRKPARVSRDRPVRTGGTHARRTGDRTRRRRGRRRTDHGVMSAMVKPDQASAAAVEACGACPVSSLLMTPPGCGLPTRGCGGCWRAGTGRSRRCGRALTRRGSARLAELERRLGMDSSDSGTPSSKERIGVKEARRARQQSERERASTSWSGWPESSSAAPIIPQVPRWCWELADRQADALAAAISDTTAVAPEVARLQGIALAAVFQIIIIGCRPARPRRPEPGRDRRRASSGGGEHPRRARPLAERLSAARAAVAETRPLRSAERHPGQEAGGVQVRGSPDWASSVVRL